MTAYRLEHWVDRLTRTAMVTEVWFEPLQCGHMQEMGMMYPDTPKGHLQRDHWLEDWAYSVRPTASCAMCEEHDDG
jgi:hypothetical protein